MNHKNMTPESTIKEDMEAFTKAGAKEGQHGPTVVEANRVSEGESDDNRSKLPLNQPPRKTENIAAR